MSLVQVPATVRPGGNLDLRLRLTGPTSPLLLRVSVHSAITSRTAFADTIAGDGQGDVVDDVSVPVAFLPRGHGDTIVRIGIQDPDQPRDPTRLGRFGTGVYPLTISLSPAGGDPVASIETWLVVAAAKLDQPLSFAWVWQLLGTPRTSTNRAEVQATVEPSGRLGRAAQALAAANGVPLSLVLGPETFETWAKIAVKDVPAATGMNAVRAALADGAGRQVLATPYVPLDLPSLNAAGLAGEVVRDLRIGADTVESVLGVLPDPRTVVLDPVDAAALNLSRDAFAQRFVVRESAVKPVPHALTPARPFRIASGGRVYPATASNGFVDHLLAGNGSRAERAQRFLAGLSLIALETPSLPRGIVVATPSNWNPDPELVATVLTGLRGHPFISATTLDGYFTSAPFDTNEDGSPIVTGLVPIRPKPPTVTVDQLAAANASLASFRSLVGDDAPRVKAGEHSILIAPSSALAPSTAKRELATIDLAAQRFLRSISTTGRTITLTSRNARVPLSFGNATGQQVRVRVHFVSSKLTFPDGADQPLDLPPGNTTKRFLVQARTSGTFTMRVTLTTDDNRFLISTTEMKVRSTAFSSLGVILTGCALLFLAVWWGNHIWRSRRARRGTTMPEPTMPEPTMPEPVL
jgi:hypothetical protein